LEKLSHDRKVITKDHWTCNYLGKISTQDSP
jgi:hypothetical protein